MPAPFLTGSGGAVMAGVTGSPKGAQNPDGANVPLTMTRNGALLASQMQGKYGAAAHRRAVFQAAIGTAAQAIPVNTTTNGTVFGIINPVGSGVNMELIRFKLDFLHTNAAPATANIIGFSIVPIATNAVSAITKVPDPISAGGHAVDLSGVAPNGYVAAVTFASALTVAANFALPLFSFPASWVPTVGGYPVPFFYDFDGSFVLPPGWVAALTASTAWAATTVSPSVSWIEYLP